MERKLNYRVLALIRPAANTELDSIPFSLCYDACSWEGMRFVRN